MIEIGSYEGRSAVWFANNILTHPTARLHCIDKFPLRSVEMRFDHNVKVSGGAPRIVKYKCTSDSILNTFERGKFDAIYVDGNHQSAFVLLDAVICHRLLKGGGIMIFDDYQWSPELPQNWRPQMAIDLFLEAFSAEYAVLLKDYQVIIRKHNNVE